MKKNETDLVSLGLDEVYTYWYKCSKCHNEEIMENANYCPGCGRKIKKGRDAE